MSHFSNQLRAMMEARKPPVSGKQLSQHLGITQSTVSRWLNDIDTPRPAHLAHLERIFPSRNDRAALYAALARDLIPANLEVRIDTASAARTGNQRATKEPDQKRQHRARMSQELRDALETIEDRAIAKPAVAQMVIATAKFLRG